MPAKKRRRKLPRTRIFRDPKGPLFCITRLDYDKKRGHGGTHGWWVRFHRGQKVYSKTFSDGVHGGKAAALVKAQDYRDGLLVTLGPPKRGIFRPPYERPSKGSVRRKTCTYWGRDGEQYEYRAWYAWIRVAPGKIVSTRWSIDKWGSLEARTRVERWLARQQKIQAANYAKLKIQAANYAKLKKRHRQGSLRK